MKRSSPAGEFTVRLASVGNPDYGQYTPVSNPETFVGASVEECAKACLEYIEKWNLGGGNWTTPPVKRAGKTVAFVSYNGRIWTPEEKAASDKTLKDALRDCAGADLAQKAESMIEAGASDEELDALLDEEPGR